MTRDYDWWKIDPAPVELVESRPQLLIEEWIRIYRTMIKHQGSATPMPVAAPIQYGEPFPLITTMKRPPGLVIG
jgi:hypothetical protein